MLTSILLVAPSACAAFMIPAQPCATRAMRATPTRMVASSFNNFDANRGARIGGGVAGAALGNKLYNTVEDILHPPVKTSSVSYSSMDVDVPASTSSFETPPLDTMPQMDVPSAPDLPSISMQAPDGSAFKAPDLSSVEAPDLSAFKVPDLPSLTAPDLSGFKAPDLPSFKAPDLPSFKAPDLSSFKAPDLSGFKVPDLPSLKAPDLSGFKAPDLSGVNAPDLSALKLPDISSLVSSPLDSALDSVSSIVVPPASASEATFSAMSVLDHAGFMASADSGGGGLPWGLIITVGFGAMGAFGLDYCASNKEPFGEGSGLVNTIAFQCGKYTDIATQKAWEIAKPAGERAFSAAKQAILG